MQRCQGHSYCIVQKKVTQYAVEYLYKKSQSYPIGTLASWCLPSLFTNSGCYALAAVPDIKWTVLKADGKTWVWDFYWETRAQALRAEDICRLQGGHLATIDSVETSQVFNDKVTSDDTGRPPFPFVHALTIVWIGLYSETPSNSRSGPW
jgi:hypothetical protein